MPIENLSSPFDTAFCRSTAPAPAPLGESQSMLAPSAAQNANAAQPIATSPFSALSEPTPMMEPAAATDDTPSAFGLSDPAPLDSYVRIPFPICSSI